MSKGEAYFKSMPEKPAKGSKKPAAKKSAKGGKKKPMK
jgi:hypothetical protein